MIDPVTQWVLDAITAAALAVLVLIVVAIAVAAIW